jgi:tryptophanase
VVPAHQGRAAERLLFESLAGPGSLVPSNTHFETTRANCLALGIEPVDLPAENFWNFDNTDAFKGNMDCAALNELLSGPRGNRVPFVLLTITNNLCGDQPVSMANIREVREITARHNKPLYLDACRYAQNAWFIQAGESGYRTKSVKSIAQEMFSCADGCFFSAKKDALSQMGGFFATRSQDTANCAREHLVLSEGFITYGGMTGRDMEMIAIGLFEGLDEDYLRYRVETTRYLFDRMQERSIPVLCPAGGHAVYIDAVRVLPHLSADENPGQALVVEIFAEGGIRSTRIVLNPVHGIARGRHVELVRLALPSRVYSTQHLDFAAATIARVAGRAASIEGLQVVSAPRLLGGFLAKYKRTSIARDPVSLLATVATLS